MEQSQQEAEELAGTPDSLEAEHAAMVAKLAKRGSDILASLTPESVHLWHMGTGVAGEAGELIDAIKKHVAYNKPVDFDNVVEELGDLEFYMEGVRSALGITRERTLLANLNKLERGNKARYKDGYSDAAAAERADKAGLTEHAPVAEGALGEKGRPGDATA